MYYYRLETDAKAKAAHNKNQASNAADRMKKIGQRKFDKKHSGKLA